MASRVPAMPTRMVDGSPSCRTDRDCAGLWPRRASMLPGWWRTKRAITPALHGPDAADRARWSDGRSGSRGPSRVRTDRPKPYLDRFASEHRLTGADLRRRIQRRAASFRIGGDPFDVEYLVHESLLRSHGEFPCAGDATVRLHANVAIQCWQPGSPRLSWHRSRRRHLRGFVGTADPDAWAAGGTIVRNIANTAKTISSPGALLPQQ
jgi:hypothetical protein